MDIEKIKAILLAAACLFMAGLNMWNEFKDWFDKTYQRKDGNRKDEKKTSGSKVVLDERGIPDVVGKSRFNLQEEELRRKQKQEEQARRLAEVAEKAEEEQNKPVHSVDLEKEENPLQEYGGPVSSEEDIILYAGHTKDDAALAGEQAATVDEFNLLAKTLQGKPVPSNEKEQVPGILQRVQGMNIYEQFTRQVQGAEGIAAAILGKADELEENGSTSPISIPDNLSKFIRT